MSNNLSLSADDTQNCNYISVCYTSNLPQQAENSGGKLMSVTNLTHLPATTTTVPSIQDNATFKNFRTRTDLNLMLPSPDHATSITWTAQLAGSWVSQWNCIQHKWRYCLKPHNRLTSTDAGLPSFKCFNVYCRVSKHNKLTIMLLIDTFLWKLDTRTDSQRALFISITSKFRVDATFLIDDMCTISTQNMMECLRSISVQIAHS